MDIPVRAVEAPGPEVPVGASQEKGQAAAPPAHLDGTRGRSQAFDLALAQRDLDLGATAATENVLAMASTSPGETPRSAEGASVLALAMAEDSTGMDSDTTLSPSSAHGAPPAVSVPSPHVAAHQVGGISLAAFLHQARLDSDRTRTMLLVAAVGAVSWELTEKQLQKDRPPSTHGPGWKDPRPKKDA